MTVYVDNLAAKYGRMIMCHMVADTFEELHEMADKIRISRRHFQNHPEHPHYDICKSKKTLAIQYGAIECSQYHALLVARRSKIGVVSK